MEMVKVRVEINGEENEQIVENNKSKSWSIKKNQ